MTTGVMLSEPLLAWPSKLRRVKHCPCGRQGYKGCNSTETVAIPWLFLEDAFYKEENRDLRFEITSLAWPSRLCQEHMCVDVGATPGNDEIGMGLLMAFIEEVISEMRVILGEFFP